MIKRFKNLDPMTKAFIKVAAVQSAILGVVLVAVHQAEKSEETETTEQ